MSRQLLLGALSLPCVTILTSVIYYYLMPIQVLTGGRNEFLGSSIQTLEWTHLAVALYAFGAAAAAIRWQFALTADPVALHAYERPYNRPMTLAVIAVAATGVLVQLLLGRLSFGEDSLSGASVDANEYGFLFLSYTLLIPLTVVAVIRYDFSRYSLLLLACTSTIIFSAGFRYRLALLLFAVTAAYLMIRRIPIRTAYALLITFVGILMMNTLSAIRVPRLGGGKMIDLTRLADLNFIDLLSGFSGEVGVLFSFNAIASNPLPQLIHVMPWVIGISRLVPSFLWSDKPSPYYFDLFWNSFYEDAGTAGVAAPQQAEILLQFGWAGLPIIAFLYFNFAGFLVSRIHYLGREGRIAGVSLAPIFFGYYMQSRGYFFQILSDGLFIFGPLFLLYYRQTTMDTLPPSVA